MGCFFYCFDKHMYRNTRVYLAFLNGFSVLFGDILDTIMGKGRSVFLILIGLLISYRLVRQVDHDLILE